MHRHPGAAGESWAIVVTCEHGGNRVPVEYRSLFRGEAATLESHRGWDPGALPLARVLASRLNAPLRYTLVTRLLVDANRSSGQASTFSDLSRTLSAADRATVMRRYHDRHWRRVRAAVERSGRLGGRVLHIGVHTFTPVWHGEEREVDVGILFDPDRAPESEVARSWIDELRIRLPDLRVRANEPYLGTDDGITTGLRAERPAAVYAGVELEVSQRLANGDSPAGDRRRLAERIAVALERAL